jgi:hypothetical protein
VTVRVRQDAPCEYAVELSSEQAEEICAVLIEMAQRLPLKHRNHEQALVWLRWFERRRA